MPDGRLALAGDGLARALAGSLPLSDGDLVVEYGPGTGPMTEVIAPQLVVRASCGG